MATVAPPARGLHARAPIFPIPLVFAASCLIGGLATDVMYVQSANVMWADFSTWLVTVGALVGWLSLLVALIELIATRSVIGFPSWPIVIGYIVALLLATLNMFVHTRDAWTSVMPWGLALSAAVVLILLLAGGFWHATRWRYEVRAVEEIT
ncbi:MAG TPA: DUF2231 domain-containing protein [Xanthobacteraceae bacterium]|nr:DUF2231 domain-containing protein [Xanthobacteraceae bacterium]